MASRAPSRTTSGTGVSHTPWARLMPLIFSHSRDITRISDCTVRAARWLVARPMLDGSPSCEISAYCNLPPSRAGYLLLVSQCHHGIHPHGAANGNQRSEE